MNRSQSPSTSTQNLIKLRKNLIIQNLLTASASFKAHNAVESELLAYVPPKYDYALERHLLQECETHALTQHHQTLQRHLLVDEIKQRYAITNEERLRVVELQEAMVGAVRAAENAKVAAVNALVEEETARRTEINNAEGMDCLSLTAQSIHLVETHKQALAAAAELQRKLEEEARVRARQLEEEERARVEAQRREAEAEAKRQAVLQKEWEALLIQRQQEEHAAAIQKEEQARAQAQQALDAERLFKEHELRRLEKLVEASRSQREQEEREAKEAEAMLQEQRQIEAEIQRQHALEVEKANQQRQALLAAQLYQQELEKQSKIAAEAAMLREQEERRLAEIRAQQEQQAREYAEHVALVEEQKRIEAQLYQEIERKKKEAELKRLEGLVLEARKQREQQEKEQREHEALVQEQLKIEAEIKRQRAMEEEKQRQALEEEKRRQREALAKELELLEAKAREQAKLKERNAMVASLTYRNDAVRSVVADLTPKTDHISAEAIRFISEVCENRQAVCDPIVKAVDGLVGMGFPVLESEEAVFCFGHASVPRCVEHLMQPSRPRAPLPKDLRQQLAVSVLRSAIESKQINHPTFPEEAMAMMTMQQPAGAPPQPQSTQRIQVAPQPTPGTMMYSNYGQPPPPGQQYSVYPPPQPQPVHPSYGYQPPPGYGVPQQPQYYVQQPQPTHQGYPAGYGYPQGVPPQPHRPQPYPQQQYQQYQQPPPYGYQPPK